MHRRDILKAVASAVPFITAGRLWAAPKADMRTLVVFLRGGYDAANVVIPVSSNFYYESRRTIAVARPGSGANAAVSLDADLGPAPRTRGVVLPFWEKMQLAFVPFVGTDDLTRSHFETQDYDRTRPAAQASRNYNSGFMARLATMLTRSRPIAFTEQLPLVFRGAASDTQFRDGGRPASPVSTIARPS